MASVKKIVNPLGDEGSQEAFRTVAGLKGTAPDLNQLIKLARNHHQATQASIDTGRQLVDHLVKLTTKMESRLGTISQAMIEISSTEKSIYGKQEEYNNTLLEKIGNSVQSQLQHERSEVQQFEKNFHKRHAEIVAEVRKAEKETKKSGKKSPYQLQQAIQDLTDKMNEITTHRQQKLEEILRMERKRYCFIVEMLLSTIEAQSTYYTSSNSLMVDQITNWKSVCASGDTLPQECQSLIRNVGVKERTSAAIQGGELSGGSDYTGSEAQYDEGYYDEGYDQAEGYSEGYYDEGYSEGYYDEGYSDEYAGGGYADNSYNAAPAGCFKARALYDYQGTHSYELCFRAGDIITVSKEDPSTGWWTGELNGVVGPFPGNYVERI